MTAFQPQLNWLQKAAFGVGVILIAVALIDAAVNAHQFFISYLFAYSFWLGLSLGCLGVAMIHYLTGGKWGFITRRFFEAGFMTLPVMAVLFVPLVFGIHELYPWARPEVVAADHVLQLKQGYLNVTAWRLRAVFFFGVWLVIAFCLRRWSLQQDASTDPAPTIRMRTLSGPGIVIYPLTATFAFIDWIMSVEAKWFSTIFAVIILIGQILTALAFVTALLVRFRDDPIFHSRLTQKHFQDLGNLLLAFVVFWTYVSFSQLLVIYSGNLPREIDWYLCRIAGGWKWVVAFLGLFHFFVPFALLLFRVNKLKPERLAFIAVLIFCVHIVEAFWVIQPSFFRQGLHVHWLDFALVLGIGGVWFSAFAWILKRHALMPQNDPCIEYPFTATAHAK